jgi:very-short-patch-repair endonuclease
MPQKPHHQSIKKPIRDLAKQMRRTPTDAEAAMWRLLRHRRFAEFKFRRQVPLQGYVLDYVCFDRKLIIEIDGSQHASSERDEIRDAAFVSAGFKIARYWNNDVLQQQSSVLEDIFAKLTATDR